MIEVWTSSDDETPLEEYPGIIGYQWDGEFFPVGACLAELKAFDWSDFDEWLDARGQKLCVRVSLSTGFKDIEVEAYDGLAYTLDQLGTIKVFEDCGPPDNPVAGSGYLFFLPEEISAETVTRDVAAVLEAFRGIVNESA